VQERVQKVHDIDKQVWTDELVDIRRLVDEELKAVRQMAAGMLPTSAQTSSLTLPPACTAADADSDDNFDIDSMKLKLGSDDDTIQPPIPELYLAQSPVLDQSLSWYVPVLFSAFDAVCWFVTKCVSPCVASQESQSCRGVEGLAD